MVLVQGVTGWQMRKSLPAELLFAAQETKPSMPAHSSVMAIKTYNSQVALCELLVIELEAGFDPILMAFQAVCKAVKKSPSV